MTATSGEDGLPIVDRGWRACATCRKNSGLSGAGRAFPARNSDFRPSDVVRFRIMLPGDFVLVEGAGVVVWVRRPGDAGRSSRSAPRSGFPRSATRTRARQANGSNPRRWWRSPIRPQASGGAQGIG